MKRPTKADKEAQLMRMGRIRTLLASIQGEFEVLASPGKASDYGAVNSIDISVDLLGIAVRDYGANIYDPTKGGTDEI